MHEKAETAYRVEGIWGLRAIRGMVGYINKPHQDVVYLYIFLNHGVAGNHLHGDGILVKY